MRHAQDPGRELVDDGLAGTAGRGPVEVAAAVAGSLAGTGVVAGGAWLAVLGFTGGTVPVAGWALPGGVLAGLVWLLCLGTAGAVVFVVAPLLVSLAVHALAPRRLVPAVARRGRPHAGPARRAA